MIHSLLGGLPELVDSEQDFHDTSNDYLARSTATEVDCAVDNETASERSATGSSNSEGPGTREQPLSAEIDGTLVHPNIGENTCVSHEGTMGNDGELDKSAISSDTVPSSDTPLAESSNPSTEATVHISTAGSHISTLELASSIPLPDSRPVSPNPSLDPSSPVQPMIPLPQEARSADHHNPSPAVSGHLPSRSRSSSLDKTRPSLMQPPNGLASHSGKSISSKPRNKPAPLSLTTLLRQADDLLITYPPSHPSLHVTEIMGPDSAMRTWRPLPISTNARDDMPEKRPYDETENYLETLVDSSQIVIPSRPSSPLLSPRLSAQKTKVSPRVRSKALLDPRRIGFRLGALTPAERRVLFMGALLVVGAAVALKSCKASCMDGIVKASGGDGLKRLWNGKWTLISSVVAAWGRGLP